MSKRPVSPHPPKLPAQRYHWARPPYRQLHVKLGPETVRVAGSGKVNSPESLRTMPSGAKNYSGTGDASPGTTTSNGGGNTLSYVQVLYYFWGEAWNNESLNPSVADVFLALSRLDDRFNNPATNYFSKLGQYGVANNEPPIAGGFMSIMGPLIVPSNPPNNPFTVGDVANLVDASLNDPLFQSYPALPGETDATYGGSLNLIYVFMPPGYTTAGSFGEHSFTTDQYGNIWAFAYTSYGSLQNITYNFSHEVIESMTDPEGSAWQVNPRNSSNWNEICDVCQSSGTVNGITVTSYWSQSDESCQIPDPPPPPPPLLPAGSFQIDCVTKARDEGGAPYIVEVGGPGDAQTGGRWLLTESDVIDLIRAGQTSFYTEANGLRSNVVVENWYLTTSPDSSLANNLDNLQSCYDV